MNKSDNTVMPNKGHNLTAEDNTQYSSELRQRVSDHGTLIFDFREFFTDSSDREVEE